jgi:nucleoside-diphosphate-sugar epimerase
MSELETKAGASEVGAAFEDFMHAFEAFKETNDERLEALERRSGSDPLVEEKLVRLDRALDAHRRVVDEIALKSARPGEIYNAVDEEPVAQIHFFRWLSETLGKWMPPFDPELAQAERKRGLTNKRVLNRKLRMELGYQFKYPTFRQGYTAEIQRLEQAGELEIELEPRS